MVTALASVREIGSGLRRPECVLAHSSGYLFAADWEAGGGVALISPHGSVRRVSVRDRATELRPNGIALEPGGSFLLAHLGTETGGIYRLYPDGSTEDVLTSVDGEFLHPTNFVLRDGRGRLWITVSTRKSPRDLGYRPDVADGYIVLFDERGARIVVDGLGYTNECLLSPDERTLFVNETFGRRLTRFSVAADGHCANRTTIATFGGGTYPDGLAWDDEGGLWITSIVSNRVIRVLSNGDQLLQLEDCDPEHLDWVESAFQSKTMGRPHLDQVRSRRLKNISCLAFGGESMRTAFLGCLLGESVATFESPIPGRKPPHWDFDLGDLIP